MSGPSKPLVVVGGRSLLEHAVEVVSAAGIERVEVVVDSLDGPVAQFCRERLPSVEVVWARDAARGNGATAAAGLAHAGGRCLVMMADHLHEPETIERLLRADGGFIFAVDSKARFVDHDDATRVVVHDGVVAAIGKGIDPYDAVETGVAVCAAQPVVALAQTLEGELSFNRLKRAWLDSGRRIGAIDIEGIFWADVDTPADRARAITHLLDLRGSKASDGPVARTLNRPLSRLVSRHLLATRVGPNPVTLVNLAMLIAAALLLALGEGSGALLVAGGILVQLASALDGVAARSRGSPAAARLSGRRSTPSATATATLR